MMVPPALVERMEEPIPERVVEPVSAMEKRDLPALEKKFATLFPVAEFCTAKVLVPSVAEVATAKEAPAKEFGSEVMLEVAMSWPKKVLPMLRKLVALVEVPMPAS